MRCETRDLLSENISLCSKRKPAALECQLDPGEHERVCAVCAKEFSFGTNHRNKFLFSAVKLALVCLFTVCVCVCVRVCKFFIFCKTSDLAQM